MLYVRYGKPTNLIKEENSAYVSFKWSQEYVDGIKSLPVRYWIPSSKEWEIPINLVPLLNKIDKEIKELNQLEKQETEFNLTEEEYRKADDEGLI